MRRSLNKQLRRLVLVAVVAMIVVIVGSYGLRRFRLYEARRTAPATPPPDVQQQAEKFMLSRSEAGQTLFTVQAERTIEREGKTTVLEDVAVVLHGQRGGRADEIRTRSCEYQPGGNGEVYCPDKVSIFLRGTPGSSVAPADETEPSIRLETAGVRFDIARSMAWTDQPVEFSFPGGEGKAVGLQYQAREPAMVLKEDVQMQMSRAGNEPIQIRGARLEYFSRSQRMRLVRPLEVRADGNLLVADHVDMILNPDFGIDRLRAKGNVLVRRSQSGREQVVRAEHAVAHYAADGLIERLDAGGGVEFTSRTSQRAERLTSQRAVLMFDPSHRVVQRVRAEGNARLVMETKEGTRRLQGPTLTLELPPDASGRRRLRAPKGGELHLSEATGEGRMIAGERLTVGFKNGSVETLRASGQVRTRENRPGQSPRRTASEELKAEFDTEGNIVSAEQWGDFQFEDDRWQAEAGRAHYRAEGELFVLKDKPSLWDATTRTTGRTIEIHEATGTVRVMEDVRTTQRPGQGNPRGFGSGIIQWAAQEMEADRTNGWIRYQGEARMWQGETRLAADRIELWREPAELRAQGNVTALLMETIGDAEGTNGSHRAVHVNSDRFTYREVESRGVFEQDVSARNAFGTLTGPRLEIFLAPGAAGGSHRLQRAHSSGGVQIVRGNRECVGEEADYSASAGTVVLQGQTPAVCEEGGSSTRGARLTLFLTDDRIRVDSSEGIRTVTRRPRTQ